MKSMSTREQIIAVATGVLVLFYVVYNWLGLGTVLEDLGAERARLANLRRRHEQACAELRLYPTITARFSQYERYSLPRRAGIDPADEFTEYVNGVIRAMGSSRVPVLRQTEEEAIEGVPNYKQILLPIEITTELPQLTDLLRTFDRERLLIRRLEIRCPIDREPQLDVELTLSRFVPVEMPAEEETPPETTPPSAASPEEETP